MKRVLYLLTVIALVFSVVLSGPIDPPRDEADGPIDPPMSNGV